MDDPRYAPRVQPGRLGAYIRRVSALDVRSLGIMRIAVALTVIVDLCTRGVHLTEHYSDDGVLPREVARATDWMADVSLLAISGSPIWAAIIFAVGLALAALVLVGWRARWTTPLLWLVVLSIQHRNPLLHDHRDVLFSLALGFGTLLPWGAAFSLDARGVRSAARITGAPAIAYVLAVASIYCFAALLKSGPEWRVDFTAVEHAIAVRYWANPAADHLLAYPTAMAVLTVLVLAFEAAVAPLLLLPWKLARWVVVIGICALQLGFAIFLWLDTFPMIATAFALGLLPSSLWRDRPAPIDPPSRRRAQIGTAAIAYLLALDVLSVAAPQTLRFAAIPAELLGVEQRWTMFAPSPSRQDGWFVLEARTAAGSTDLLTGRPVSWSMPASFRAGIRTTRELVYMRRLLALDDAARHAFAATRCTPKVTAVVLSFVPIVAGERKPTRTLVEHACEPRHE